MVFRGSGGVRRPRRSSTRSCSRGGNEGGEGPLGRGDSCAWVELAVRGGGGNGSGGGSATGADERPRGREGVCSHNRRENNGGERGVGNG
jgi:hypothetical protein